MEEVFFFLSLKILFKKLNLLNSYDKTNLTVFVLSLWGKDRSASIIPVNFGGTIIISSRVHFTI